MYSDVLPLLWKLKVYIATHIKRIQAQAAYGTLEPATAKHSHKEITAWKRPGLRSLSPLIVGALIILIPGLIVALAMRQRGVEALGLAAPISVGIFGVSAIFASKVGVRFSFLIPLAFAVILAGLGYLICRLLGSRGWLDFPAPQKRRDQQENTAIVRSGWFTPQTLAAGLSVLVGFILLYISIARAIGRPEYISQTYDVNFHLNAIRYMADTGDASSLTIANMTSGGEAPTFYPAVWHGIATVIYQVTGISVPATANLMSVLVGAVIWPLSVMYLVRSTMRASIPALLSVGVVSASFTAFPMLLIHFGVLYPKYTHGNRGGKT